MSLPDALQELLEQAAEAGPRRPLQLCAESPTRRRLVPAKSDEGLLSYRARLAAIKSGGLRAYRHSGKLFIDLAEESAYIGSAAHVVRTEAPQAETPPATATSVGMPARWATGSLCWTTGPASRAAMRRSPICFRSAARSGPRSCCACRPEALLEMDYVS